MRPRIKVSSRKIGSSEMKTPKPFFIAERKNGKYISSRVDYEGYNKRIRGLHQTMPGFSSNKVRRFQ